MGKRKKPWLLLGAMAVFFLLEQAAVNFLPDQPLVKMILKGLATLSAAALCALGARRTGDGADKLLTAGMVVCVPADMIINFRFWLGAALFAAAHILFCAAFLRVAKPTKRQLAGYAIALAAGCAALLIVRERAGGNLIPAMLYMVTLSLRQKKRLMIGALIFALSDLLLGINVAFGQTTLSQFISLAVYYVALGVMASSTWRVKETVGA